MTETSEIYTASPIDAEAITQWSSPTLLAEGKYNVLYLSSRHGKRFVLKALRPEYRDSAIHMQQLDKEFHIAAELDHPGIARTLDFGHQSTIGHFIQMEYVDGRTMGEWLMEKPTHKARKRVLIQLLEVIGYLHQKQILHRDLKPANILITHNGDNVRLIDFGIADADDYVILKQPGGSKGFIAPEILEGKMADCRADIYAIGKIMALLFPHGYRAIAARCSRTDRERRYANAEVVLHAIEREERLLRLFPLLLLAAGLLVTTGIAYHGYRQTLAMQENLMVYEQEDRLVGDMIAAADSIFNSSVCEPFKRGEIAYVQDWVEAIENGRKEIDKLVSSIDNETLQTKAHSAAYDVWMRNCNQFIEVKQPYQLPLRPQK